MLVSGLQVVKHATAYAFPWVARKRALDCCQTRIGKAQIDSKARAVRPPYSHSGRSGWL